jgi:N-alpha-acetyltransferase 10/11
VGELVTLMAAAQTAPGHSVRLPAGYRMRACGRGDIDELGRVYFEAYDPGTSWPTVEQATADVRSAFEGEYGELWKEASQVVALDGGIVAAVLTVRRPPWDDTPDCPFIIDLFTDRTHRRRGLARALIGSVLSQAASAGESGVALRVRPNNMPPAASVTVAQKPNSR